MGRRVGVIGGGILGLAVGRELLRRDPDLHLTVFEKEDRLASHQTGHNSGVVHAGLYYAPGSLKADLCLRGRSMLAEYCAEKSIPYRQCGKLVVAVDSLELPRLEALERQARFNGVPGLLRVASEQMRDIEPHAAGISALHSPSTAITDYVSVAQALASDIEAGAGQIRLGSAVVDIARTLGGLRVRTRAGKVDTFDRLVVCAGLHSDRVARLVDHQSDPRIVPFRGDYLSVRAHKRDLVRGMIYPVPDPRYPFLGVHFTRRVTGQLDVGPNAVLAIDREGYGRTAWRLADLHETITWPGFWRLARLHWRTGVDEFRSSMFKRTFMRVAQRYVPDIGLNDVERGGSGVRAQAVGRDGTLIDDFRITQQDGVTSLRNAPSPAATSSLAIAEHVVALMYAR